MTIASSGSGGLFAGGSGDTFASANFQTKTNMTARSSRRTTPTSSRTRTSAAQRPGHGRRRRPRRLRDRPSRLTSATRPNTDRHPGSRRHHRQLRPRRRGRRPPRAACSPRGRTRPPSVRAPRPGTITVGGSTRSSSRTAPPVLGNVDTSIVAEYAESTSTPPPTRAARASAAWRRLDRDDQREHRCARLGLQRPTITTSELTVAVNQKVTAYDTSSPELRRLPRLRQRRRRRDHVAVAPDLLGGRASSCSASRTRPRGGRRRQHHELVNVPVRDDNGHCFSTTRSPTRTPSGSSPARRSRSTTSSTTTARTRGSSPTTSTGVSATPDGEIWGSGGVFEFQQTWDYVKMLNASSLNIVTNIIDVVNTTQLAADRDPRRHDADDGGGANTPGLDRDGGPGTTFDFDIKYTFPPTLVLITNTCAFSCPARTRSSGSTTTSRTRSGTTQIDERERRHLSGSDSARAHPHERPRSRRAARRHRPPEPDARRTPTPSATRSRSSSCKYRHATEFCGGDRHHACTTSSSRSTPARTRSSTSRRSAGPTRRSARLHDHDRTTSTPATTSTSSSTTARTATTQSTLTLVDGRHVQPRHGVLRLTSSRTVQPGARRDDAAQLCAVPRRRLRHRRRQVRDALPARRRRLRASTHILRAFGTTTTDDRLDLRLHRRSAPATTSTSATSRPAARSRRPAATTRSTSATHVDHGAAHARTTSSTSIGEHRRRLDRRRDPPRRARRPGHRDRPRSRSSSGRTATSPTPSWSATCSSGTSTRRTATSRCSRRSGSSTPTACRRSTSPA